MAIAAVRESVTRTRDWDVRWARLESRPLNVHIGLLPFSGHIVEIEEVPDAVEIRIKELEEGRGYVTKLSGVRGSLGTCRLLAHRYCGALVGRAVLENAVKVSDIFPFDEITLSSVFSEICRDSESWTGDVLGTSVLAASGVSLSWAEGFMFQCFGRNFIPEAWYLYDLRRLYSRLGLADNIKAKAADIHCRMAGGAGDSLIQEIGDTVSCLDAEAERLSLAADMRYISPAEYAKKKRSDEIWVTCVPCFRDSGHQAGEDPAGSPAEVTEVHADACAHEAAAEEPPGLCHCDGTCRCAPETVSSEVPPEILIELPELQEIRESIGTLTDQIRRLREEISGMAGILQDLKSPRPCRISVTSGDQKKRLD